jgi:hypothetical protein
VHFSDHDIKQVDDHYLRGLPAESLQSFSGKLLADLKEPHDRLDQNPSNSSRPPSTRAPWEKDDGGLDKTRTPDAGEIEAEAPTGRAKGDWVAVQNVKGHSTSAEGEAKPRDETKPGRPERRKGAPGVSRTQVLPVGATEMHRPATCAACGTPLSEDLEYRPYTPRFELNAPVLALMDRLVTRTFDPPYPVRREPVVSQWFLSVRSHWLPMPPGLLKGRLSRKAWRQMGSRIGSP